MNTEKDKPNRIGKPLRDVGVWAISAYVVEVEVVLERHTIEGESPVHANDMAL